MEGTSTSVAASPPEKAWPRVLPGGLAKAACLQVRASQAITDMDPGAEEMESLKLTEF